MHVSARLCMASAAPRATLAALPTMQCQWFLLITTARGAHTHSFTVGLALFSVSASVRSESLLFSSLVV